MKSSVSSNSTQVQAFVDKVQHELKVDDRPEAQRPPSEREGRVPFRTAMLLTEEQEARMVEHAVKRIKALRVELGGENSGATADDSDSARAGLATQDASFYAKRELFELVYQNKVEWRKSHLGGIFKESNLIVPLARRIVRQMVARAIDYFFATDPWLAAYPEGIDDQELAEKTDRFARWKIDRAKIKSVLSNAIELAFVRGETVVKTTHVTKEQLYRSFAKVLVDGDGRVVLDANGDYIFEDDAWVEQMQADPTSGQPIATGIKVLKKDGRTPMPSAPVFVEQLITRKLTLYRGPEAGVVYYRDFLCPLTATDLQSADFIAHGYDLPLMALADYYKRRDLFQGSADDSLDALRGAVRVIKDMLGNGSQPKAEVNQPRSEHGETTNDAGENNPSAHCYECYLTFDADGDGIQEEIMLALDLTNQKAIFYDYLPNVCEDGMRPFTPIRINFLDGRWHGIGAMEMFWSSQEFVDLLVNRLNFAQGGSGRVTFWNPRNTVEGQNNSALKLNHGETYTPIEGKTAEDCLSYVTLPEVKGPDLFKLMEFFTQIAQLESGVVHAGDQQFAGLESAKLATGIRNIEKSGQEMFGLYLGQLEPCIQDVLSKVLGLIFANMDPKELFEYMEGDVRAIGEITAEEVKNLPMNVRLLLTRYRGEQQLQSNMQAAEAVEKFYSLAPEVQARVAPMYRQILKSLQIKQADEIIQPLPVVAAAGGQLDPQAGTAAIQARPPGQSAPNL